MSTAVVRLKGELFPPLALLLADVERWMSNYAAVGDGELTKHQLGQHLQTGGKRLRARLALAAGEALGAPPADSTAWAAAVEMMHNATLIHDDIQDQDRMRRGSPTTWARYGVAQAINVGDLGLMLPFSIVADMATTADVSAGLMSLLAQHGVRAAEGQTLTLTMLSNRQFDFKTYRRCIEGTTGAFFALPIEGAAILAGFNTADARALAAGFLRLGVLYQLQDDVLDLYGSKGRDLPGGDLRAGKVSALVIEHLERCPSDAQWLVPLLEQPRDKTTLSQVRFAADRFRASGTLTGCLARIDAVVEEIAQDEFLFGCPALRDVALSCLALAMQPIDRLREAK